MNNLIPTFFQLNSNLFIAYQFKTTSTMYITKNYCCQILSINICKPKLILEVFMVKYSFGPRNILQLLLYLKLQSRWNQGDKRSNCPLSQILEKTHIFRTSYSLDIKTKTGSEQNNNWCYINITCTLGQLGCGVYNFGE